MTPGPVPPRLSWEQDCWTYPSRLNGRWNLTYPVWQPSCRNRTFYVARGGQHRQHYELQNSYDQEPSSCIPPPLGLDFSAAADEIRTADDAREIMSGFGGSAEYWTQAEQASNFVSRVHAYLSQDVAKASKSVACPIIVIWPTAVHSDTPQGWRALVCEPTEAPARILSTLDLRVRRGSF